MSTEKTDIHQNKLRSFPRLVALAVLLLLGGCFADNSTPLGTQGGVVSEGLETRVSREESDKGKETKPGTEENIAGIQSSLLEVKILTENPRYTVKKLDKEELVFIDRPYFFSDVSQYGGLCMLQTAMNDKREEGANFLQFSISQPVTVYVGYDTRWPLPIWLSDWIDTGDELIMADDNARYWPYLPLRLFKKDFPAGVIELGGNGGAGSMYVVLLEDTGGSGDCSLLNDRKLELSWYPNQDKVDGYNIYVEKEARLVPFLSVELNELEDPQNPSLTFLSWSELGITGKRVCFSISAYLENMESDLSTSKCIDI